MYADKFYLVDAGYINMPGFLAPYRSERRHLQEFHGGQDIHGYKELFNFRHSQLRTTIERTFGVFKKRFPIFKLMPSYKPSRQGSMMIAACACHNWIRMNSKDDNWFVTEELNWPLGNMEGDAVYIGNAADELLEIDMSPNGIRAMDQFRDALATTMYQHNP